MTQKSASPSRKQSDAKEHAPSRCSFGMFTYLNDDLKHHVLSFIADAPLEEMPKNYPASALTHSLPCVSKKFHRLSLSDMYWKTALVRQAAREPLLWRKALSEICHNADPTSSHHGNVLSSSSLTSQSATWQSVRSPKESIIEDEEGESDEKLIERTYDSLGRPSYKSIYRDVVSNHLRFKGPVLEMLGQVQLGTPYEFHSNSTIVVALFASLLRDHQHAPSSHGHGGGAILVHANRGPLAPSTPAVLSQVLRCQMVGEDRDGGGGADATAVQVTLLPFAHVWLEKVFYMNDKLSSPSSTSSLHQPPRFLHAQCLKMGKGVTADMNRLARQEALIYIMDRLASQFRDNGNDDDDIDDDDIDDDGDDDDDMDSISDEEHDDASEGGAPEGIDVAME